MMRVGFLETAGRAGIGLETNLPQGFPLDQFLSRVIKLYSQQTLSTPGRVAQPPPPHKQSLFHFSFRLCSFDATIPASI